jgi:hypothetical protein
MGHAVCLMKPRIGGAHQFRLSGGGPGLPRHLATHSSGHATDDLQLAAGRGLKKCMPATRPGAAPGAASCVMAMRKVDARMVVGLFSAASLEQLVLHRAAPPRPSMMRSACTMPRSVVTVRWAIASVAQQ